MAGPKVAEHSPASGTVYRHGLFTREAIAERKATRALILSFREDARAALSESRQPPVPDPREEVPEAHGLPLPGLRSAACADPLLGPASVKQRKNADAAARRRCGMCAGATAGMRK
jgi:hypothetical protein